MKKPFSVVTLFVFVGMALNAQVGKELVQLNKRQFTDGERIGKLHEFQSYFESDPMSKRLFVKYDKTRRTQRVVNYAALGITALAVANLAFNKSIDTGTNGSHGAFVVYLGSILVGPSIMLLANPIFEIVKRKRKAKLLHRMREDIGYGNANPFSLSIAQTSNGLGFVFAF